MQKYTMKNLTEWTLLGVILLMVSFVHAADPAAVWNIAELEQVPEAEWKPVMERVVQDDQGNNVPVETRKVYYANGTWKENPIRVMAFFSKPKGDGPFPGIVLIHGGGGSAFSSWTEQWAARGYAAISMDLAGKEVIPDTFTEGQKEKRSMPDGGNPGTDTLQFADFSVEDGGYRDTWICQSIAAIMRAHSLIDSLPCVDPNRTAATGISWGGYLACILAGVDHRFQVIVPVYGCGNLWKNSLWTGPFFAHMTPEHLARWNEYCDPTSYFKYATCPVLLVTGTDDRAYPLAIHRETWQTHLAADVRLTVHMPHSHHDGWKPREIADYIDWVLNKTTPLPCLEPIEVTTRADGSIDIHAAYKYGVKPKSGALFYSTDEAGYDAEAKLQISEWSRIEATVGQDALHATLPESVTGSVRFFLEAVDEKGRTATTHYAERTR